jgi:GTP-binding protein
VNGHRIKPKYMAQTKARPPTFVLFASRADQLPDSYRRYLVNSMRESFDLPGVPVRLTVKSNKNPFTEDGPEPKPGYKPSRAKLRSMEEAPRRKAVATPALPTDEVAAAPDPTRPPRPKSNRKTSAKPSRAVSGASKPKKLTAAKLARPSRAKSGAKSGTKSSAKPKRPRPSTRRS